MKGSILVKTSESEIKKLINLLPTGVHAGTTEDGKTCVLTVVNGESLMVKIHSPIGFSLTQYNSEGKAILKKDGITKI